MRRQFLQALGLGGAAAAAGFPKPAPAPSGSTDVREAGAAGDGKRLDTAALQSAIDACARGGGGTVRFPAGRYLTGTLVLRSRVTLHLEAGAVLLGSRDLADYLQKAPKMRSYTDNYTEKSLIYAEDVEQVAIEGRGTIDGQGAAFEGPYKLRPYLMRFIECRRVAVEGVTLLDSPMWVQHYLGCDDVAIHGITVRSRVNRNNDGIDIDGCRNVRISGCNIISGDDAIVLKSTADRVCRDVVITNCIVSSHCNGLKLGTETNGGFENIAISNCTVYDTRLAGLTLQIVDGGRLDRVVVSNLAMQNVGAPIFVRLGNRARPFEQGGPQPGVGSMRNVTISGIEATGCSRIGCGVAGLPGHPIEEVTIADVRLAFTGGGSAKDAVRDVPEHPEKYPEHNMFGALPAYGLYCRHVAGLTLRGVRTRYAGSEARPALICDDVERLDLSGFEGAVADGAAVRFTDVRDAFVHGCRAVNSAPVWLEVRGARTRGITLAANELSRASRAVAAEAGVPKGAVTGA
jgi:polygalacturonase